MSINKIILIGNLTKDPEMGETANGIAFCKMTVAVNRKMDKGCDFLNCTAWRQSAEYLCNYGRKGNLVAVAGMLTSRKWEDQNGNKRTSFEIVVDNAELLSSRSENAEGSLMGNTPNSAQSENFGGNNVGYQVVSADINEDLPF